MTQRRTDRHAFTLVETMIVVAVLLVLVGLALPGFAHLRREARMGQNATQLRGIAQGMQAWTYSSKHGGPDGWLPGLRRGGASIPVEDVIPAADLAAAIDIPGYAAGASANLLPAEMNGSAGRGFIVRAMADLAAGDFIPAGSAECFINPADPVKTPFLAGDPGSAGRFDASKISYTTLDLSKSDGGVFPFKPAWREDADPDAVLLANRAVGDGSDPATRSSVWTPPGSGEWRGIVALHDGSAVYADGVDAPVFGLGRYGGLPIESGSIRNAFAPGVRLRSAPAGIASTSGLLYDEADPGTDPDAF